MNKQDKLIEKFKAAKIFKWKDMVTLLTGLGFEEIQREGSRVMFVNDEVIIKLHKPHPGNEMKEYAVKDVKEILKSEGFL